jgi:flagellar protein FliO/FliZ
MGIAVLLEFLGLSALVVGLAFVALRLLGQRFLARGRNLRLREALSLGPNRLVALLEVAGKVYLLGVSPNRIEVLDEIDPSELLAPDEDDPDRTRRSLTEMLGSLEERVRRLTGR